MKRTSYLVTVLSADGDAPLETFDIAEAIETGMRDRPLLFVAVAPGTPTTIAGADVDVADEDAVNRWLADAAVVAREFRRPVIHTKTGGAR